MFWPKVLALQSLFQTIPVGRGTEPEGIHLNTSKRDLPWAVAGKVVPNGVEHRARGFDSVRDDDSFDPESLWERVNGDADLLRDLVELFSQESPKILQAIGAAIEQGSFIEVQKASHKMKGSALQFSAKGLAAAAAAMEEMARRQDQAGARTMFGAMEREAAKLTNALESMVYHRNP